MRISSTVVRRRAVVVVLILAMLGVGMATTTLQTPSVKAYALIGPKWANQPSPHNCCASLGVVVYPYLQSYDITGWHDGMSAWNGSPALILFNNVDSSTIVLDDTYDTSTGADGWVDWQALFGYFVDSHGYLNTRYTAHYTRPEIQGVAAHELGHVAGLKDVNTSCVLMNGWQDVWVDCGFNVPKQDDINGIDAMY